MKSIASHPRLGLFTAARGCAGSLALGLVLGLGGCGGDPTEGSAPAEKPDVVSSLPPVTDGGADGAALGEDQPTESDATASGEDVEGKAETEASPPAEEEKAKRVDRGLGVPGGRTLPPAAIKSTIKRNLPQVKACYERELKQKPTLEGKVVVAWTIGADGRVRRPRVVRNSTGSRGFLPCVTRSVASWRFPRAESPSDIEYPFVFRSNQGWR